MQPTGVPYALFFHRTGRTGLDVRDGKRLAKTIGILQFSLIAPEAWDYAHTAEIGARLIAAFETKEWDVPSGGQIIVSNMMHQILNGIRGGVRTEIVDGSFVIARNF